MPYKNREDRLNYLREWRKNNSEKVKNYKKTDKWKEWHEGYVKGDVATNYRQKYNKQKSEQFRQERLDRRNKTYNGMGGKCVNCGFNDFRALQIDHINGDGKKERHLLNRRDYYENVLKSFLKRENRYQILCCNCNWIKRVDNKEYRKKTI